MVDVWVLVDGGVVVEKDIHLQTANNGDEMGEYCEEQPSSDKTKWNNLALKRRYHREGGCPK